jgi:hypothetical protein
MDRGSKRKVVDVDKGLLLVRYASADDEAQPPKISVAVNPRHEKNIQLVSNPLHSDALLWQPGTALVFRAAQPGQLFVDVLANAPGGSTAATVKVEMLNQGEAVQAAAKGPSARDTAGGNLDDIRIVGHVAGIGDVTVRAGEWIAGPIAPARIEGLAITWPDKPHGLDLRYSVKLARANAASERITALGGYAGTRGQVLPVVGLTLELAGAAASDYEFSAEAIFLGAAVSRVRGRRLDLAGPTGREPLVGLRLRVEEIAAPLQPVLAPVAGTRASGRVRVFRSRPAQPAARGSAFADPVGERSVAG